MGVRILCGKGHFEGVRPVEKLCKAHDFERLGKQVSCLKAAELIKIMLYGRQTHMGSRKPALRGVQVGPTWQIRLNNRCSSVMLPLL